MHGNQFEDCLLLDQVFFHKKTGNCCQPICKVFEFLKNKNISFIKMLKSKGPSMEPYGTPDLIFLHILKQFPRLHICFLFVRWFFMNSKDKLLKLYASSLAINREWSTVLKALGKSIHIAPILFPLCCVLWFLQNTVRYLENLSLIYKLICR